MKTLTRSKVLSGSVAALALVTLAGCATPTTSNSGPAMTPTPSVSPTATPTQTNSTATTYDNKMYKFTFDLPASWTGYTVLTTSWQGTEVSTGKTVQSGSIISIRSPKWTKAKPTQDIPIMVFTLSQWALVKSEKLAVGAAPIPPSELGRNSQFVFALPARYNYAFPAGYQEVETILAGHPLHAY